MYDFELCGFLEYSKNVKRKPQKNEFLKGLQWEKEIEYLFTVR